MLKVFFNPATHVGPLPSPCISVCRMHPKSGLCEGCLRTSTEISDWHIATEDAKRAIWMELMVRRCKLEAEALGASIGSGTDINFDATGDD